MVWISRGILFPFLFFLFRYVIREQLDENDFRRCFFPRKYHSESTWSQLCSKFFINNHKSTWQQHLKDTLQLNILWTWVSGLHQDIWLIIVCFSFSQTSLVFKFILMLIQWFLPQFIYLSTFWYCVLKFSPYLYALFIRASKFSWASILFFFCDGLQLQIVNMFFYFPWNVSAC